MHKVIKWIILSIGVAMALFALWQVNRIARQIEQSEAEKVRLWASAVGQRNRVTEYAENFYQSIQADERQKIELYTKVLRSFGSQDLGSDVEFTLAFVNYIMDSCRMEVIITDKDSIITSCRNVSATDDNVSPSQQKEGYSTQSAVPNDERLIGQKLQGELLQEFSQNPPFRYKVWGMPFILYYKESQIYSDMRQILESLSESFLADITNNSVKVPVIIIDSANQNVISYGNIAQNSFNTPEKLTAKLNDMQSENMPISIQLPLPLHQNDQQGSDKKGVDIPSDSTSQQHTIHDTPSYTALVYYEQTSLLRALHWVPVLYIIIAIVLILVTYNLIRTSHSMEQNKIYVGLAKETAHQLGTPISSLLAWSEYLEGKTFDENYANEIRKDLSRLETVAHRFSKIGSTPQLEIGSISEVINHSINYLEHRSSKKIKFAVNLPEEPLMAPINSYLLEWVFENITRNAIDAMTSNVKNTANKQSPLYIVTAWQDSHRIYIDLADNGCGMSQHTQKHIFDSGFTTKSRGWGLGLPLAKRIVEQYHHGKIFIVYSVEGQGTTFRITLPKK